MNAARRIAGSPLAALCLVSVYPAIFVLSSNWYMLTLEKAAFVLLVSVGIGLAMYLVVRLVTAAVIRLVSMVARRETAALKEIVAAGLIALACNGILFFLMYGTIRAIIGEPSLILALLSAATVLTAWLAAKGRLVYYTSFFAVVTSVSLVTWLVSFVSASVEARAEHERAIASTPFKDVKFEKRPNIYLIIYDAYGSRALYSEVFGVDNSAIYGILADRGFKVIDTYANYWATWSTMLSLFGGGHHYYDHNVGNRDSALGRAIMNGTAFNPVFSTLWENGYRTQIIEPFHYLVKEQGKLDFNHPEEPIYSGLRAFNNPWLDARLNLSVAPNSLEGYFKDMTDVLFERLKVTASNGGRPWFTYVHFHFPAHGPHPDLERTYPSRTRVANAHIASTTDRILQQDPDALLIIMGDHGSHRYYGDQWKVDDPNANFAPGNIDKNVMALDFFGILVAVHSKQRCDDFIYDTLTPVNLMRVVFACLSGRHSLLDGKAADISLYRGSSGPPYVAVQDGKRLSPWTRLAR